MLGKCRDMPSRYKVVIIGRDATQDIGIWATSVSGPGREMLHQTPVQWPGAPGDDNPSLHQAGPGH